MITRLLRCGLALWVAYCVLTPTLGFAQDSGASGRFVKVFDVLDSGFKDWTFSAFGLIFIAIGLVIFVFPSAIRALGIPYLNVQSGFRALSRYGVLGFAILWTAFVFYGTYSAHLRHRTLAREGRCRNVEGPVEHFVPMPYAGHAQESFSVDGAPFRYSDFNVTDGFNNTSSHGGPINGDSHVRICYDPSDGAILRLEIRDFKGDPKDYARAESMFPKAPDVRNSGRKNVPIDMPWYSNLFLLLFVLDAIAIYALYLPYLKTFFRLKTMTAGDCPIPGGLETGSRIKLRNSMIYWDVEGQAIWLRPRGWNLVQIPLTVAKLRTDLSRTSIDQVETRFSSGFPFVMALFLWTAYRVFSATFPNGAALSPAQFFGIAAALFLLAGFLNLRILGSRMDRLVEDALSEFRDKRNS
jgi:hypothetical protein